jgi:hypothetical protein
MAALFLVVLIAPIILNITAWHRLIHMAHGEPSTIGWRKIAGWVGLAASSLTIAMPWVMVVLNFLAFDWLPPNPGLLVREAIPDLNVAVTATLTFAAIAVIAGLLGPRVIRFQLIGAGVIAGTFWFFIPLAIL